MSPRSEELLAVAWERLQAARALLERELWGPAVSDAYYAILYAARAALSERDRNAKMHRGIWTIFSEEFVASGDIDAELAREARATQEPREGVDDAAARISRGEARRITEVAERFVPAIETLLRA
jgi:uncharacterized protein (UPF0332 family)